MKRDGSKRFETRSRKSASVTGKKFRRTAKDRFQKATTAGRSDGVQGLNLMDA
jgi:hypothetical protein